MNETAINRLQEDDFCTVFTAERKFINKILEYAKQYPDEVTIQYTNPDGSIGAKVPSNWFCFVKPPIKRNFTEEQKQAAGERMKKAREAKNS